MSVPIPYAHLGNAAVLTDRHLLRRSGTLWAPPRAGGGAPVLIEAPRLMAGATFGDDGFAGVDFAGRPFAVGMDLASSGFVGAVGQCCAVAGDPLGAVWIRADGGIGVHRGCNHMRFHGAPDRGEQVLDVAMELASGLVLMHNLEVRFMHCRASPVVHAADEPVRDLALRVPEAVAVAGNGACVAVVDRDGRPHFAGSMARGFASQVPVNLPPLTSIALSSNVRAAGLDAEGRILDWGEEAVGREALPEAMREPGFGCVCVGPDWIAAVDRTGWAHGFGRGMAAWAGVDVLAELLALSAGH